MNVDARHEAPPHCSREVTVYMKANYSRKVDRMKWTSCMAARSPDLILMDFM
jgi:hypothetical protein